jgi:hypothetical protein
MKYLAKDPQSPIIAADWTYSTTSHRPKIRQKLLAEQQDFCAYTERYVAVEVHGDKGRREGGEPPEREAVTESRMKSKGSRC